VSETDTPGGSIGRPFNSSAAYRYDWRPDGSRGSYVNTVLNKVILPALLSPVVAAPIAMTVTYLALRVITPAEPRLARRGFKGSQTVSASMVALAHGTNDAQKTMGAITLALRDFEALPNAEPAEVLGIALWALNRVPISPLPREYQAEWDGA
jgi:phosphate/sulfate permease